MSVFEKMAGVELRPRSGIRGDLRNRLQVHRSSSQSRLKRYPDALGKRCAATDLLLGTALVSARTRRHLSDRIRIAVGASGRTDRQRWCVARESVPAGSPRTTGQSSVRYSAHALLVQYEQRVSTFPLWWRRCPLGAFDLRDRARALARRPFCFLPVPHPCWTKLP